MLSRVSLQVLRVNTRVSCLSPFQIPARTFFHFGKPKVQAKTVDVVKDGEAAPKKGIMGFWKDLVEEANKLEAEEAAAKKSGGTVSEAKVLSTKSDSTAKPDSNSSESGNTLVPVTSKENPNLSSLRMVRGDDPHLHAKGKTGFMQRTFTYESHPSTYPEEFYWYLLTDGAYFATHRVITPHDLDEQNTSSPAIQYWSRYTDQSFDPAELFDPNNVMITQISSYYFYKYDDGFFVASKGVLE